MIVNVKSAVKDLKVPYKETNPFTFWLYICYNQCSTEDL